MKNFTSINTPSIIINGYKQNDLSGDYIDLYNYHILECSCNLELNAPDRFILPIYIDSNVGTVNYKYDYIWLGRIYKKEYIKINNKEYQTLAYCDYNENETLNWKAFCIRRYS